MIITNFDELLKKYNLMQEFTMDVIDELDEIADTVPPELTIGRRNLCDLRIFTIDGDDAKDLDDAISISIMENGNYYLGVHIADVSYYVKENTALDRSAQERGTSVYLVDKVIPMLPQKLSNGICSLHPHVDRLTMSVFMEITPDGNVVNYEIYESVINSAHRMTYTNVTAILNGDKKLIEEYNNIYEDLKIMEQLAEALRAKRTRRGALDFDVPESKIITDSEGKPIEIKKHEITVSNRMIEEFMLACNETVARHLEHLELPVVYRVHEKPEYEKIEKLAHLLHSLGYDFKLKSNVSPNSLQKVLHQIAGKDEQLVISTIMLRSMMKARYSEESLGHFGLAAKYYCHFTSPIRRYPDLAVHRILKAQIHGNVDENRRLSFNRYVIQVAEQSSLTEVNAVEAERTWTDFKMCEYMADHVGEDFDGIIASVTSFGLYVELPNTVEGLVHISQLKGDYYIYDEVHFCLTGKRTGRRYSIGEKITVRLAKVNVELGQIDFVPIENLIQKQKPKPGTMQKNTKKSKRPQQKRGAKNAKDKKL